MKELILNNPEFVVSFISAFFTWFFGYLAKKSKLVRNNRIPIQNILICFCTILLYYGITGNISMIVASGSPIATLLYDLIHNLKKEV